VSERNKSTFDLIENGEACPTCGATWRHFHIYPPNLQSETIKGWTWAPETTDDIDVAVGYELDQIAAKIDMNLNRRPSETDADFRVRVLQSWFLHNI